VIRTSWLAAPAAALVVALASAGCSSPAETVAPAPAETASTAAPSFEIPYPSLAARIVTSLQPSQGERVLLRYNPDALGPLEPEVRRQLEAKGAVVESLQYGEAPDLAERLARTDIYVWLPAHGAATPPDQRALLAKWLDDGRGRQIHFHWGEGTRDADGLTVPHSETYDRIYVDALDIDYAELSRRQEAAIGVLRSGETHVTTPDGTDIRFTIGPDRPFSKQDGNASAERMKTAKVRVDREIELPAGVLRVAPIEKTVNGTLAIPKARFGDATATGIKLTFTNGVVSNVAAESGLDAVQTFLTSAPGASHFRELCLGFNPKLQVPAGQTALPYYGYGDAVARLGLGDNFEVGGEVRGGGVRWLFFPNTTITVGDTTLVRDGKLVN
jgi:hypothetical protein